MAQDSERRNSYMEGDFDPGHSPTSLPPPDVRVAAALEYAAYQLGQINKKMSTLIEVIGEAGERRYSNE